MNDVRETYSVIPITQHIRPNNKLEEGTIGIAESGLKAALGLIEFGYSFHAEVITPTQVSITIEYPEDHPKAGEEDFATAIVPNGPELLEKIADLANTSYKRIQS